MVTRVEVVLGTGKLLSAQRRGSGPDLLPLLIGSEGTLGIITRVGLRLHPAPTARAFSAFAFENIEQGVGALRLLFQEGLRPAVARLYDPLDTLLMRSEEEQDRTGPAKASRPGAHPGFAAAGLRAALKAPGIVARAMLAAEKTLYSRSALVLVHEGNADDVEREAARATQLCQMARGTHLGEGPARAWYRHRYHVSYRQSVVFRAGTFSDTMEVAAPWSRVLDVYHAVRRALGEHALVMAHLSHSYPDGSSLYFTFAGAPHSGKTALEVYDAAWRAALSAALDAGATLSHHHGVGRSKAPRVGEELGAAVDVVRALKTAWDPSTILNPGALLPPSGRREGWPEPLAPSAPKLDTESCLVELPGAWSMASARAWLGARGHELPLEGELRPELAALSVDAWIALGCPGQPDLYADPVRTRLAGFCATLTNGLRFRLPAAPRRAVGPDLSALFVGTKSRFGRIESATFYAPRKGAPAAVQLPFEGDREPELNSSELRALDAIEMTLAGPR
jgi:alkyldihydroxyacetonephosphate synthase